MAIVPTVDLVDRPSSMGYDGFIDNILIRLAVTPETPFEDLTAEATPPRVDTVGSAEDVKDEVGQRYSRANLTGGAGLDFMHEKGRPADSDVRFWDSKGVDVFREEHGEIYRVPLLHRVDANGGSWNDITDVGHIDGLIHYTRADGIWELGGPTRVLTRSSILKTIFSGNRVYTMDNATGIQWHDHQAWGSGTLISDTYVYTDMWFVKNRIVAAYGEHLYDTDNDTTPIFSLPAGETFTTVIDAGAAILAFDSMGSVTALTLDQDLALVTAGNSRFLEDEIITHATHSFGTVGITTSQPTEAGGKVLRFYRASLGLSGSYALEQIQLMFQLGDRDSTDDLTCTAILASRDSIYIASPEEGSTERTLWRYYLPTGGYARSHTIDPGGASDQITSLVLVDDRFTLGVDNDDLWQETDEYVATGYIISPLADFFTSDDKQWIGADLAGLIPVAASFIELYDTTDAELIKDPDSSSWRLVHSLGYGTEEVTSSELTGRSSRYHAFKVVIRSPSDRLTSPEWGSSSFRALPAPERDVLVRIPINVSDQIESRGRRATRIPGRGQAMEDALRAYEGKYVNIELYRPEFEIRGLIEKFESTIKTIPNRGSVRHVMYARVRGTRLHESVGYSAVQTDGVSYAQWQWALAQYGVGVTA